MITRRPFLFFPTAALLCLTLQVAPLSASSPEIALQAEQMLGAERWAQAVAIENTNSESRYPETVYGTVFEFNDTLWFYTATGTQPLKASKQRTEDYKDSLLPLLRTMDRGFTSFRKLSAERTETTTELPSLKNGCVIESIFSLDELQEQGKPILRANLLLYSAKNTRRGAKSTGHCVLVYQTPDGMYFIDPPEIGVTGRLKKVQEWDPAKIADEIESNYRKVEIEDAFFEPFTLPVSSLAQSS